MARDLTNLMALKILFVFKGDQGISYSISVRLNFIVHKVQTLPSPLQVVTLHTCVYILVYMYVFIRVHMYI